MIRNLIFFLVLCMQPLCALEGDEDIWRLIYEGNGSVCKKMILLRKAESIEDKMTSQAMFAYYFYKKNDKENCVNMIRTIDEILSFELNDDLGD